MVGFGGGELALERKDQSSPESEAAGAAKPARRKPAKAVQGDVGSALRTAYEQTISENIPAEMLDLLGKLA